ncbi:MAG TPA: GGDEF domain-containing protein [Humisphaera sp.]|nr:GGDEF domain-containing protein [Humisphaera sp.]
MIDRLTGVWNRDYRDLHLPAQLSLARRISKPLSCVMAEIDGLSGISRTFGETTANNVVRQVARILAGQGRVEDMLCSLESGKFSLLLPATSQAGAARLANRTRAQIEHQFRVASEITVNATCSFGVADTLHGSDLSLLDRADAALNCAKHSGGNCISVSPPAMTGNAVPA